MTFIANLDLDTAFRFLTKWRNAGRRARIVQMENGRWLVAQLESVAHKAL